MTPEQLRAACEKAGMPTKLNATGLLWQAKDSDGKWRYLDHPMMRAYVASLLVAMVRKAQSGVLWHEYERQLRARHESWPLLATPEQIIEACMEVLP